MRAALEIDDDVLAPAKASAVVSELAPCDPWRPVHLGARNGVPLLTTNKPEARVSLDTINRLRDEAP